MTGRLVVVGGGEHARVVVDAAAASGWQVAGYTDADAPDGVGGMPDIQRLGTDADLAATLAATGPGDRPAVVLGFGAVGAARRRAVEAVGGGATWAVVVHPSAWVSPSAILGPGAVVLAGAVVNTGARVGAHAIVNSGAIVEHDVAVVDHAHVAPGAVIGGGARIGEGAFVGLGAAVRDHVTVGDGAIVAMGAVVTSNVPAGALAKGIPARSTAGQPDGGRARG